MNSSDLMRQAISEARDANRAVDNHAIFIAGALAIGAALVFGISWLGECGKCQMEKEELCIPDF